MLPHVESKTIERWRAIDSTIALKAISTYMKQDTAFAPTLSQSTTRWHVLVGEFEYEVLCTGPKFFDVRAGRGGGGAVDVAMYFRHVDFRGAVALLLAGGV